MGYGSGKSCYTWLVNWGTMQSVLGFHQCCSRLCLFFCKILGPAQQVILIAGGPKFYLLLIVAHFLWTCLTLITVVVPASMTCRVPCLENRTVRCWTADFISHACICPIFFYDRLRLGLIGTITIITETLLYSAVYVCHTVTIYWSRGDGIVEIASGARFSPGSIR